MKPKITIIDGNNEIELSTVEENIKAYMVKGEKGADGTSPTASVSKTGSTSKLIVTDANGTTQVNVLDGYNPTITTSRTGHTTTITTTDINGTTDTEIYDGIDLTGGVPTDGIIGWAGADADIPNGYEATTELQEKLVSGTNIKTINNNSILGSGNIDITGSSPIGSITMFAGSTAPSGYLICDGSAISRTTYSDLFTVLGTNYGTGDGSTTFNLPNLKGRTVVGLDSNDTAFDTLGETGGEKTHTLTVQEMPSHSHSSSGGNFATTDVSSISAYGSGNATLYTLSRATNTNTTGEGQAHNNMPPYIVLNYIIKY